VRAGPFVLRSAPTGRPDVPRPARSLTLAAALLLLAGCAPALSQGGSDGESEDRAESPPDGALVVQSEAFSRSSGSVIRVLSRELTSMEVVYRRTVSECPLISLRGPVTGTELSNPLVYVDGTRSSGTCMLNTLNSGEIDHVEVYPTGKTSRPGYVTHPHGLILVFMLGGGRGEETLGRPRVGGSRRGRSVHRP